MKLLKCNKCKEKDELIELQYKQIKQHKKALTDYQLLMEDLKQDLVKQTMVLEKEYAQSQAFIDLINMTQQMPNMGLDTLNDILNGYLGCKHVTTLWKEDDKYVIKATTLPRQCDITYVVNNTTSIKHMNKMWSGETEDIPLLKQYEGYENRDIIIYPIIVNELMLPWKITPLSGMKELMGFLIIEYELGTLNPEFLKYIEQFMIKLEIIIQNIRTRNEFLENMTKDSLTTIANRDYWEYEIQKTVGEYNQLGKEFVLVFTDIDLFKQINDTHGHLKGDEVLKKVATTLKNNIRPYDKVFRVGGDEFAIIFKTSDIDGMLGRLERIKQQINSTTFQGTDGTVFHTTLSFGVYKPTHKPLTVHNAYIEVDKQLYRAKDKGRNQICHKC